MQPQFLCPEIATKKAYPFHSLDANQTIIPITFPTITFTLSSLKIQWLHLFSLAKVSPGV